MSSVLLYEARFSQKMGVQSAHINMGPEQPKIFLSWKMKLSNVLINVGQGKFFCYIISLPNMHLQLLGLLWSTLYLVSYLQIKNLLSTFLFYISLSFNISILNGAKFKAWMKLLPTKKSSRTHSSVQWSILKQKMYYIVFFPIHKVILLYSTFFTIDTWE